MARRLIFETKQLLRAKNHSYSRSISRRKLLIKLSCRGKWSAETVDGQESVKFLIAQNSIFVTGRVVFNVKDVFFSL